MIQAVVVNEFYEEIERAKQPGYVSRYDDFDFEYSDAPRSKPARFDGAHGFPAERPQANSRSSPNSEGVPKNHFRREPLEDGHRTSRTPPPAGGLFGAGILPQ